MDGMGRKQIFPRISGGMQPHHALGLEPWEPTGIPVSTAWKEFICVVAKLWINCVVPICSSGNIIWTQVVGKMMVLTSMDCPPAFWHLSFLVLLNYIVGVGIRAQQIEPPLVMWTSPIGVLVHIWDPLFLFQLSANVPRKKVDDDPINHMGDPAGVVKSWFWHGPAKVTVEWINKRKISPLK